MEQQTAEVAFRQPQQEQANEPQQQCRFSARQSARSIGSTVKAGVSTLTGVESVSTGVHGIVFGPVREDAAE